jgi:hypothetical protein
MNTYKFKMTRVYETMVVVQADSDTDAQKRFEDRKYDEELSQCNVLEEKVELVQKLSEIETALLWFKENGFHAFEDGEGSIYISVNDFSIQVTNSEVSYRAEVWRDQKERI